VRLLFDRDLLRLDDLADQILLHHFSRVRRVTDILERFAALLAALFQQDFFTARVLVQKLCYIIDVIVNDEPATAVVVVLLHFLKTVGLHHFVGGVLNDRVRSVEIKVAVVCVDAAA